MLAKRIKKLSTLIISTVPLVIGCTSQVADNTPSNEKTNLEFGMTTSALTGRPTPTAPTAGQDVAIVLPTFTWTLADDNTDRVQLWVNHAGGTVNPFLTRAETNCVSPDLTCEYTLQPGQELDAGRATWWLLAIDDDDSTNSGWTTGIVFTVQNTVQATLVSPVGNENTSFNPPDLVWQPVASSTDYTLWIADSNPNTNTVDLQISYTPTDLGCEDGVTNCTLSAAQLSNDLLNATGVGTLQNGVVNWFIQTSNNQWSDEGVFTIVNACENDPLGATCDDNNLCTNDSCDTNTDPAGVCVNADNAVACDDNNACTTQDICQSGQCRALDQANCAVDSGDAAFAPIGDILDPNTDYTWAQVTGVTQYRLMVQNIANNEYVLDQTVTCTTPTCTYEPGTLPNGSFRWWVQTPPLLGGCCTVQDFGLGQQETWHGPWSAVQTFTVGYSRPATVSPIDDVVETDLTPSLRWTAVPGTNHTYQVWITDANYTVRQDTITEATAGCAGGGTCTYIVPTALPGGWTQWWVMANNSELWSAHSSFCVTGATCNIIF